MANYVKNNSTCRNLHFAILECTRLIDPEPTNCLRAVNKKIFQCTHACEHRYVAGAVNSVTDDFE